MEAVESTEIVEKKPSRTELLKRYVVYALLLITALILLYIFVWFGTQLGLQN
jgi:preprotein translocase subunit SecF